MVNIIIEFYSNKSNVTLKSEGLLKWNNSNRIFRLNQRITPHFSCRRMPSSGMISVWMRATRYEVPQGICNYSTYSKLLHVLDLPFLRNTKYFTSRPKSFAFTAVLSSPLPCVLYFLPISYSSNLSLQWYLASTSFWISPLLCKIWGFHGGDYEEWCLLGCYAVWLL
jgi:hypothetical protein